MQEMDKLLYNSCSYSEFPAQIFDTVYYAHYNSSTKPTSDLASTGVTAVLIFELLLDMFFSFVCICIKIVKDKVLCF